MTRESRSVKDEIAKKECRSVLAPAMGLRTRHWGYRKSGLEANF